MPLQPSTLLPACPSARLPACLPLCPQVGEVAARLQQASQEQYIASLAFLVELQAHSSPRVRAFWQ